MKDYVEKEHNTLDKYWWNIYWEVCRNNGMKIKTEVTFQEKKNPITEVKSEVTFCVNDPGRKVSNLIKFLKHHNYTQKIPRELLWYMNPIEA